MATPRTGRPRGRPRGTPNRRTVEQKAAVARVAELVESQIPEAFTGDAHAFLMTVYKDPTLDMPVRIDAAGKAIRFEKPMLSAVEAKVAMTLEDLTEAQLDAELARQGALIGVVTTGETAH